jgi:glycosyltransferase involved in cell wall biosynthesis
MRGKHKLKILHICENYKPDYGGGASVYVQDICKFLSQRGYEVRVLCTETKERESYTLSTNYDNEIRVDRINLPYFRHRDPEGGNLSSQEWNEHEKRIAQLINAYLDVWTPDIVNYHTARPLGEECLLAVSQRLIPIVVLLHDGWLICQRSTFLRSPLSTPCSGPSALKCFECIYSHYDDSHIKAFLKLPWRIFNLGKRPLNRLRRRKLMTSKIKGVMGVSQFMTQHHKPHLNSLVIHIPLGIDLTMLPNEKPIRPRNPLRFGFIGGSQEHKGLTDVLDSAAALKREGLSFELFVWGNKSDECIEAIRVRDLEECVKYRGTYQSEELWEVYNEMDVALMATIVAEPFGRVPLEAAAVGAITIAPAVGGITESIRDEVDGLLFQFREAKDLERQMRRILTEEGLFERLQSNLQPVLDTKDAVAKVEEFYFQILGINNL